MLLKITGRVIGLGAVIILIWMFYEIFRYGSITFIETNLWILSIEFLFAAAGFVLLIKDIIQEVKND